MNHNQKKINALRLIELVHQNEVIYNPKHPEFHDYGHKETVWAGIDQRLNCQEGDSKRKWTMLRDAFRRSVKIVQRNPNRREFKFARQMKFLLPFFQKFPKAEAEKDDYHNTINYQSADSRDGPEEVQVEHMDPESFAECLLINELDEEEKSRLIGDERMSIEFNHKQADPLAHTNHQSKYPSPLGISSRTTDAIDGFLLGIGASLRTFNPYNLNIAKQRIFNVVSDLEMEQIKARQAAIMAKYPTPGGSKRKTPALITADESANKKEKYINDKIIFEDDKTSETDGEENE